MQSGELWVYFLPFPGRGEPVFPGSYWQQDLMATFLSCLLKEGIPCTWEPESYRHWLNAGC